MQFSFTIATVLLSLGAVNAAPAPQLDALTGLVGSLTSALGGVTGGSGLPTGEQGTGGTSANNGGTTAILPEGNYTNVASCPENTQAYCCDPTYASSGGLLNLDCLVQSVMGAGSTCDKESVCCTNNGGTQFCTASNGAEVNVPLTLGGLDIL